LLKGIVKRVKSKHGSPRKRSKASKREFWELLLRKPHEPEILVHRLRQWEDKWCLRLLLHVDKQFTGVQEIWTTIGLDIEWINSFHLSRNISYRICNGCWNSISLCSSDLKVTERSALHCWNGALRCRYTTQLL
jgi:hypothetical protein